MAQDRLQKDGTITGQHLKSALDGGAYGSYGVASTYYTGALQTVTYNLPNYRFEGVRTFTNKPPCGPKRGHGTPQPRFAWEVQLDKAARRLGSIRPTCACATSRSPRRVTANWLQDRLDRPRACIEAVVEGLGWRERHGKLPEGRGLGLACGAYLCGAGLPIYWNHMPQSGVQLLLDRSGRVAVFCGEAEIGQGSDSVAGGGASPRPSGRSGRHPAVRRRYRPDSGRSGQLLLAGDPDDGQRRARGRRARPRDAGGARSPSGSRSRRRGWSSPSGGCSTPSDPDHGV